MTIAKTLKNNNLGTYILNLNNSSKPVALTLTTLQSESTSNSYPHLDPNPYTRFVIANL